MKTAVNAFGLNGEECTDIRFASENVARQPKNESCFCVSALILLAETEDKCARVEPLWVHGTWVIGFYENTATVCLQAVKLQRSQIREQVFIGPRQQPDDYGSRTNGKENNELDHNYPPVIDVQVGGFSSPALGLW